VTPPTIQTQNYTIRPFKKEDALLWQTWDIDPEIQAHMPEPKNEPQNILEQYEYIEECEKDEEGYYWSIETNDGVTIGTVSLFEINSHHKTGDLGIVIGDKNYWSKGVATEVLNTLIPYAFEHLDIIRISAEVEAANIPMQKVFEKVGFTQDGVFKDARVKEGKRIDVIHFGIIKSE
jgi:[ribosomal protein S5]-alanine N-acetyltransferase